MVANNDDGVIIGTESNIDRSVVIKSKSQIGNLVKIAGSTQIGENCRVGDHANIAKHCTIENDVVISNNVNINTGTTIRSGSVIGQYVDIGSNVKIGNRVKVNERAKIADGAEIKDDSLIDKSSQIGVNAEIAANVYIGKSASIPADGIVNEYAILHERAKIPNGYTVSNNEVVICSPSPVQLHKDCASIESISNDQVQITSATSFAPSKAFNDMLRGLLDVQINDVKVKCEQGNTVARPDLSTIKTLFLIQRYGQDRFNETYKKVNEPLWSFSASSNSGDVRINDLRIPAAFHFGENEDNDILEPDVKKKFILLLEIEEDAERVNRVKNDTFCSVTAQMLNGERDITVTDPNKDNFAFTKKNNSNSCCILS